MTDIQHLRVDHETRYDYTDPVELAQHLAYLRPLDDEWQRVVEHRLTIDPEPSHARAGLDAWGNHRGFFSHNAPHRHLSVRAVSTVALALRPDMGAVADALPWEEVAGRLAYTVGAPYEPACEFSVPSPMVPRLDGLRALARTCFVPGTNVAHGAAALMHHIKTSFAYASGSTGIDTPVAYVLSTRRGVCQDFAHVMIGALRMLGLAARYVSGYLLTAPPPGRARMVGADASHAWVAVWCPRARGDAVWLELDPTNDVVASTSHVRLAMGRDFGDVAPLRGVIRGGSGQKLKVRVHTEQVPAPR